MQTENRDLKAEKMAMTVKDVSFSYGKNQVLKGVSLEIPKGKITTILGANGCGKSTLFSPLIKSIALPEIYGATSINMFASNADIITKIRYFLLPAI